jgi:hypothetical protein
MRRHRVVFDWSRRLTAAALTIFAVYHFAPSPAQANGGEAWRLAEISGVVQVQRGDGAWRAAAPGTALVAGQALATGADGRAVLRADGDVITVSPGSHVLVPNEGGDASGANIVQRLGTLLYKVERAPQRRFAVDTPFLAAVVKGTVFTVVVRADGGALQVTEGAVEVAALASGEVALIRPGQIAQVPAGPAGRLMILDRGQHPRPAAPGGDGKQGAAPEGDGERKAASSGFAILKTVGGGTLDLRDATQGLVGNNTATAATAGSGDATASSTSTAPTTTRADSTPVGGVTTAAIGAVSTTLDSVSSGDLNLTSTTTTATSTVDAVTAPLASTASAVTAPLASTVDAVTAPLASTVTTTTTTVTTTGSNLLTTTTSTLGGIVGGLLGR